jgi:radical SAM superfamily enzyme YgiQ (UPF0313 family)
MQQKEIISGLNPLNISDLILVNSPLRDYGQRAKDDYEVLPPMGLAYIATHAAQHGHNVGLIDAEHHGLEQARLASMVNDLNPRYVGINVFTPTRTQALHFAEQLAPDLPLVIGGPHATTLTERTLREFSAVHNKVVLIRSEAEIAVTALLDGKRAEQIPGAFWLENGCLYFTPGLSVPNSLDELPQLDRKFLANDPSVDRHTGRIESRVLTSRGCPFNCTICAGAREVLNLPVRNRSAKNVAQEIQGLVTDDNVQSIRFVDDLFIASEKRVRSILDAINTVGISNLFWDSTGRANILAKFSPEIFDYLKANGASEIALGIESRSERLRNRINKQASLTEIEKSVDELTRRGIKVKGYFVIGIPTETRAETLSTLNFAKQLSQDHVDSFRSSVFIFRPYPATAEWDYLLKHGFSEDELLSMSAEGEGERAKHEVSPTQQFGECSPKELKDLLSQHDRWQADFLR